MMVVDSECRFCGSDAESKREALKSQTIVSCSKCGIYYYSDSTEAYIKQGGESKFFACAYYYFTHIAMKTKPYQIYVKNFREEDDEYKVSVDEIMNLYPKTISQKIDMALMNLSALSGGLGRSFKLILNGNYIPVFMSIDSSEADFISNIMRKEPHYLSGTNTFANGVQKTSLTHAAWQRIDELQKQNAKHKKGFIAMWFKEEMDPTREAIKEVFVETGYQISIIDEKQHNNQIVPEILYEIETSDFIVADLTGNRNGVYYEAGYALGQGKEVILTMDKNKIDEDYDNAPHFDVAQINQIRYENLDDLKVQLFNRITATVGNLKNPNAELKKYVSNTSGIEVGKDE